MKATRRALGLIGLVVLAGGCASSRLSVQPVKGDDKVRGIRYSLPKPFLVVKPSPTGDGSFTVEVVFLPNVDQTYAISGSTRRGKYALDVTTKDGLLQKITWNSEDSAVTDAAVKAASEMAKAAVDKREADQKAADEERAAAQKAARAELKTAQELVDSKTLALRLADLELASTRGAAATPPTIAEREAIRQAELKRQKAEAELLDAQSRLAQRRLDLSAVSNAPMSVPGPENPPPAFEKFWGPVIYEIRDTGAAVNLVPVEWKVSAHQIQLDTATANPPQSAPAAAAAANTLTVAGATRQDSKVIVTLNAQLPVRTVDKDQADLRSSDGVAVSAVEAAVDSDGKRIRLTFDSVAAGSYLLFVQGENVDGTSFSTDAGLKVEVP